MNLLGSCTVLLFKNVSKKLLDCFLAFGAGIMISASFFSLLNPAINKANELNMISWIVISIGFLFGGLLIILADIFLNKMIANKNIKANKRSILMFSAITLHNIPEGMAVGAVFAGFIMGHVEISLMGALALSIGIAIQNIPEGAIVSFDMKHKGESNKKSFLYGTISGVVEPLGSLVVILFTSLLSSVIPYFLSFAAGAMVYVVVEELIPESQNGKHSNIATIGVMLGFVLMMILDVVLG
jgi:ZIP family zinc transporter